MNSNLFIPAALAGLLALSACGDNVQAGGGGSAAASSEKKLYSFEERESFQADMERAIDKLESRVAEVRAKAAETGREIRAETQRLIDDIQAQLPELRQKLAEVKGATREGWADFSRKFHDVVDDLRRRFDSAFP